jgi:hypothetical protein
MGPIHIIAHIHTHSPTPTPILPLSLPRFESKSEEISKKLQIARAETASGKMNPSITTANTDMRGSASDPESQPQPQSQSQSRSQSQSQSQSPSFFIASPLSPGAFSSISQSRSQSRPRSPPYKTNPLGIGTLLTSAIHEDPKPTLPWSMTPTGTRIRSSSRSSLTLTVRQTLIVTQSEPKPALNFHSNATRMQLASSARRTL